MSVGSTEKDSRSSKALSYFLGEYYTNGYAAFEIKSGGIWVEIVSEKSETE
jgi:hypothetical protein